MNGALSRQLCAEDGDSSTIRQMREQVVQDSGGCIAVGNAKKYDAMKDSGESNRFRIAHHHFNVPPFLSGDLLARVDRNFGTDLNPEDLSRIADSLDQVRETSAWTAARVQHSITRPQLQ